MAERPKGRLAVVGQVVNGAVLGQAGDPVRGSLAISAGRVVDVGSLTATRPATGVLDATGCTVAPGFVDLQVNGGDGIDLTAAPHRIGDFAAFLPATGVTSFLPTVITSPRATVAAALDAMRAYHHSAGTSQALGLHLEGPFLAPARRGAHPSRHLRPIDLGDVRDWVATGAVAMVTLAPELEGALDAIRLLTESGVLVSAGHSEATLADFVAAVDAGARGVTHLFNAMNPVTHRNPSMIVGALTMSDVVAGIIVDGVHVDPATVRLAWACAAGRLALITDAMAAARLGDGTFTLGRVAVTVRNGAARTEDGTLAGSVLAMDEAVRNLVAFTGCRPGDALRAASTVPANLLRRSDLGRLVPGAIADVVLVDADLRVQATVVGGVLAFDRDGRWSP